MAEAKCLAELKSIGITPVVHSHPVVTNVEQWAPEVAKLGVDADLAKNMFLKGKKGELVLVFALASTKTDLKLVGKAVGAASGSLRFAPEDVLTATLGVVQGAVTPLALVNDAKKEVIVVVDEEVLKTPKQIPVHPCRNDSTVFLSAKEIQAFITHLGYTIKTVNFAEAPEEAAPAPAAAKPAPKAAPKAQHADPNDGESKLGIDVAKMDDFPGWYSQVITKAEMIEYYDVSGCYILRPWAYEIWEHIRQFFDFEIRERGVEDCYFPMFVSKAALEREKDHVEGFAPEVAWVTKAGSADLENPVAIRPTSETVMYPIFAKWLRSHRDLPIRLNQWCNVVRWEFSHPTPFIRTREFLWQEGHSAWETKGGADKEVLDILDLYRQVYEDLLAVPVAMGTKTEKEKFAGALYTTSVEAFIPAVGRGCQAATSHCLGQNFAKMFNMTFEDPAASDGSKLHPWQTSWGLTTRTIGIMIMVHGDDKGLVLPPRVASVQVVIVPCGITAKTTKEEKEAHLLKCEELQKTIKKSGLRIKADMRQQYSPGWKYNYWELKGVPVRLEVGPKELASGTLLAVVRHDGSKHTISAANAAVELRALLEKVHTDMFEKAKAQRVSQTRQITNWKEFVTSLNERCVVLAPWCGVTECENAIKKESAEEAKTAAAVDERAPSMGAKSLNVPFSQPELHEGTTCIGRSCGKKATKWVLFGRSY